MPCGHTDANCAYKVRNGEIGRESSQRIPGEESFGAKSRKKSGLQVGRAPCKMLSSDLAQSWSPVAIIMAKMWPQPPSEEPDPEGEPSG